MICWDCGICATLAKSKTVDIVEHPEGVLVFTGDQGKRFDLRCNAAGHYLVQRGNEKRTTAASSEAQTP